MFTELHPIGHWAGSGQPKLGCESVLRVGSFGFAYFLRGKHAPRRATSSLPCPVDSGSAPLREGSIAVETPQSSEGPRVCRSAALLARSPSRCNPRTEVLDRRPLCLRWASASPPPSHRRRNGTPITGRARGFGVLCQGADPGPAQVSRPPCRSALPRSERPSSHRLRPRGRCRSAAKAEGERHHQGDVTLTGSEIDPRSFRLMQAAEPFELPHVCRRAMCLVE